MSSVPRWVPLPPVTGGAPLPPELSPRRGVGVPATDRSGWQRSGWRRFVRALSWVAVATSVLVVAVSAGGYAYLRYLDGNIHRVSVFAATDAARPADTVGATNFLLAGSDTRVGQDTGFQGVGSTFVSGARSDSVLLAHVSATNQVTVLSFPRDSYVKIPAFTDPTTGQKYPQTMNKLNASFAEGGPALLVQTIENLSGLRIDHFVQVDFGQFKDIVDSLGGVQVCLTQPARDAMTGINLPAGTQRINGDTALQYVRQRYGLPLSDLDRIGRQQRFLASVIRATTSSGTLLNPVKLNGFLTAVTKSITVDNSTTLDDLVTLGSRLKGLKAGGVQFLSLPYSELGHSFGGDVGDALVIDAPKATALFQALHDDQNLNPTAGTSATTTPTATTTAPPSAPAAVLTVPPTQITVTVQNGTGTPGQAIAALTALQQLGFRSGGARNTTPGAPTPPQTQVRYPASLSDSAETVHATLPGSALVLDPTTTTILVVTGTNYTGTTQVTVDGQAYGTATVATTPPTVPAASSPAAPVVTAETATCGI